MAIPNYKEVTATIKKWTRGGLVIINNTFGKLPYIVYGEQQAIDENGKIAIANTVGLQKSMNPSEEFPVIDQDGNFIRMSTEAELYTLMASHYLYCALKRDEKNPSVKVVRYPLVQQIQER
jgi:hypothetical protein